MQIKVTGASTYEQAQGEVPAAVQVITREEIRAFGWRTIDAALASLPGVYTAYDRQNTFFGFRGLGLPGDYNSRVLLMINGNRINDPTYDSAPFGYTFPLDIDMVERIEFIPGPGGAVYGQNAMFAVINIVTRDAAGSSGLELAGATQTPQGLWQGRASGAAHLPGGVSVLLSASSLDARGQNLYYDYTGSGIAGVADGMDGERDRQLFARLERGPWAFDLVDGEEVKGDPTGAYGADPLVPGQNQTTGLTTTQLRYQDRFDAQQLQLTARLFSGQEHYREWQSYSGSWYDTVADGHWFGGELQLLAAEIDAHKILAGLEYQDNTHADESVYSISYPSTDDFVPSSGWRGGAYAQDEWHLADALTWTLGLRADRTNSYGTRLSPRAGLIWQATAATTLRASYGSAQRAPNAFERVFSEADSELSNPGLRGERIDTAELIVDQRIARDFAVRASIYHWTLLDLIQAYISPITGVGQYQTGNIVRARGAELSADRTWDSGWRLRGSISLQDAEQERSPPLPNSPRTLGKLEVSGPLPWLGLQLAYEWQFVSSRLDDSGVDEGAYAVSNVQLVADGWLRGLELSLGAYNLFDKAYEQPDGDYGWMSSIAQDGLSVRVKAVYRF